MSRLSLQRTRIVEYQRVSVGVEDCDSVQEDRFLYFRTQGKVFVRPPRVSQSPRAFVGEKRVNNNTNFVDQFPLKVQRRQRSRDADIEQESLGLLYCGSGQGETMMNPLSP